MAHVKKAFGPSPGRRHWSMGVFGLLVIACCGNASALSQDSTLRDLRHTAWSGKEGAPDGISAMVQTRDGYVWLGSGSGLYRFDGLRFEHIDLPHGDRPVSSNVSGLFAPASGGLWIGFRFGGVAFFKDGRLTRYTTSDGLPDGTVRTFAEDRSGVIWAGARDGLAKLEGSRWHAVGAAEHYPGSNATALLVDSAGTLWAASQHTTSFLLRGETLFRDSGDRSDETIDMSAGLAELPSGEVWLSRKDNLRRLAVNAPSRKAASSGAYLLSDKDGGLWTMAMDGGIVRIANAAAMPSSFRTGSLRKPDTFSEEDGRVVAAGSLPMLEDSEGNVWVVSGVGLDRFSERNVALAPPFKNDGNTDFTSYVADFASPEQGPLWVTPSQFELYTDAPDGSGKRELVGWVTGRLRNADGSIWLGSDKGLWRFSEGRLERRALPEDFAGTVVQAIAQDGTGGLWVSFVGKGVFRLADQRWTRNGGIAALPKATAITLVTDRRQRVWFGYTEGRIALLDGDRVTLFAEDERAPVGNVTALYGKRSGVWAGGESGLALFDGARFRKVTLDSGRDIGGVTGIVETADGDVWVNCNAGILRLPADQVRRAATASAERLHGEVFDVLDGVEGSATTLRPLPTAIEAGDGRLWFARHTRIYFVDPAHLHRNEAPPTTWVQAIVVDDKTYPPVGDLVLPKGTTSLRIDYVAPNMTLAERVRYRYRLDGVDAGWQDVGGRRQAFYTNLRPGNYRFRVIAANNDGVWNDEGATLDFAITPRFVQTGWFVALCIALAATALGLLVRFRFRQLAAGMRLRYEARMAERERIARELHDTLLQGTQGLVYKVQAASKRIAPDQPAHGMLEEALTRASEVIAEGRDRIQDLRVPTEPGRDLGTSLAAVGHELGRGGAAAFRTTVEGTDRPLLPRARDEAYRIGREAIINAFRHADARSIEVQVVFSSDAFILRVRDDGAGIEPKALEAGALPGHWGLPGMRERALEIGATLAVWSRSGVGTEVELRIPKRKAYPGSVARSRWLAFGRPA